MKPLIGIIMRCEETAEKTSIQYAMEFVRTTIIKAQGEPFFLTPPQNLDYYKTKYADYIPLTAEKVYRLWPLYLRTSNQQRNTNSSRVSRNAVNVML